MSIVGDVIDGVADAIGGMGGGGWLKFGAAIASGNFAAAGVMLATELAKDELGPEEQALLAERADQGPTGDLILDESGAAR